MYTVTLEYPPKGTNHMYTRTARGVHLDSDVDAWRVRQGFALRDVPAEALFTREVEMVIAVYRPSKRGDIDNRLKLILDVLQGVAYTNDALVRRLTVDNLRAPKAPRVEVSWWGYGDLIAGLNQMVQEV